MTTGVFIGAIVASFIAGWIDAVVGGGGLVLIPALLALFPTAPPATIMGTNKFAAIWGTSSAAITYLRQVQVSRKFLFATFPLAIIGAAVGASATAFLNPVLLRPIILVLLVAVGIFVTFRPAFGTTKVTVALNRIGKLKLLGTLGAIFAISCYDGFLGPGTGIFFIILLASMLSHSLLGASTMAKVLNVGTNLGALTTFVLTGNVNWSLGIALALANIAGAQLGARTALKMGSKFIRIVLLMVVLALVAKLSWDQLA